MDHRPQFVALALALAITFIEVLKKAGQLEVATLLVETLQTGGRKIAAHFLLLVAMMLMLILVHLQLDQMVAPAGVLFQAMDTSNGWKVANVIAFALLRFTEMLEIASRSVGHCGLADGRIDRRPQKDDSDGRRKLHGCYWTSSLAVWLFAKASVLGRFTLPGNHTEAKGE